MTKGRCSKKGLMKKHFWPFEPYLKLCKIRWVGPLHLSLPLDLSLAGMKVPFNAEDPILTVYLCTRVKVPCREVEGKRGSLICW